MGDQGGRRVADLVVHLLASGGVTDWFGVAGTTVMPLLEAISRDGRIRYHGARHEHVAMDMASGYARVSSRLGVCMTHVGPGVTNTVTSLVTSARDRVPVLLISGNEESWTLIRNPYHDWRATAAMSPLTRYSHRVERATDAATALRQAVSAALRSVPGPVHLDFPEDVLATELDDATWDLLAADESWWRSALGAGCSGPLSRPRPSQQEIDRVVELVRQARRPLIVAGEMVHWSGAVPAVSGLAHTIGAPVATVLGGACLAGVPGGLGTIGRFGTGQANEALTSADLVIALGAGLLDTDTLKWTRPGRDVPIVQVHPDPDVVDFRMAASVGIVADVRSFAEDLAAATQDRAAPALWLEPQDATAVSGDLGDLERAVVSGLAPALPADWVVTMDPGYAALSVGVDGAFGPTRRIYPHGFGTMGFAIPAAAGATMSGQAAGAVVILGDGAFFMSLPALDTIATEGLPVHIVVFDDGGFGSQRQKQREGYAGNTFGVDYDNPDLARLSSALRVESRLVSDVSEVAAACKAILGGRGPSVTVVPRNRVQTKSWYEGMKTPW
jgi:acetolactate synthase-1/2/3 large subunit